MATGYLFQDRCYPSLAGATSAHWTQTPAAFTPGSTSYLTDMVYSGSAWVIRKYTINSGGTMTLTSSTTAPALTFETCDTTANFKDGATLGAAVAGAMVIAYVIRRMGWAV